MAKDLKGRVDYAIITVREEEFEAVLKRYPNYRPVKGERILCSLSEIAANDGSHANVIITRCLGQGESKARDVSEAIMDELSPQWILLVGIAGGYPAFEFGLGDVVISSKLIDFNIWAALEGRIQEFDVSGGRFHSSVEKLLQNLPAFKDALSNWSRTDTIGFLRPTLNLPDGLNHEDLYGEPSWRRKVFDCLKHYLEKRDPQPVVVIRPTISAGVLDKDTNLSEQWRVSARSVADVEMELAGVYNAVVSKTDILPRILGVRGISDIIGYKRSHDWLGYACHTAASFVYYLIQSGVMNLACTESTAGKEGT